MKCHGSEINKVMVTGGAGFIGSALVRSLVSEEGVQVLNVDKLTYAGNKDSLKPIDGLDNYTFLKADICDAETISRVISEFKPDVVMNLAAESHVDRSIDSAEDFIQTNIVGTYRLLEVARRYWDSLPSDRSKYFRFHHISTDEVYGDLSETEAPFSEASSYRPSSPYSATKASSDHLVRAWHRTYGLPTLISNCSNNYGPYQFPEKLIPLMILNAIEGKPLPVFGSGLHVRDWLYVDDHVDALCCVLEAGKMGETYNIGGDSERSNLSVVHTLCDLLPEMLELHAPHISANLPADLTQLIQHVDDRPGHDVRYAINADKITSELGWRPIETFATGMRKTVEWYLNNLAWVQSVQKNSYERERLGLHFQRDKKYI